MIRVLKIFIFVLLTLNLLALFLYLALPEYFQAREKEADMSWTEGWLAAGEKGGARLSSVELHQLRAQKSSIDVIEKDEDSLKASTGGKLSGRVDSLQDQKEGLLWNPKAVISEDLFQEDQTMDDSSENSKVSRGLDMRSPGLSESPKSSQRALETEDFSPRKEILIPELEIELDGYTSLPEVSLRTTLAKISFTNTQKIEAPALKTTPEQRPKPLSPQSKIEDRASVPATEKKAPPVIPVVIDKDSGLQSVKTAFRPEPKSLPEKKKPVREKIPEGFFRLENKIYDPFSRSLKPEAWVRCKGEGTIEVMIDKSLLENLEGAPLSQDHIEVWIHKTGTAPPEGYGEISYQIGVGLGEDPWVLNFITAEESLKPVIRRHESQDFVVLEIGGFQEEGLFWNLVFSKAILREQGSWEQGLLFSAARNFEWGKKDSLFALDKPLTGK